MGTIKNFPMENACELIAANVVEQCRRQIETELRRHIEPLIKDIAASQAKALCERVDVMYQRDVREPGKLSVYVSFNGAAHG